MYYHVGYRAYDPGTVVRTYRQDLLASLVSPMRRVRTVLENPELRDLPREASRTQGMVVLPPGGVRPIYRASGPGAVREIRVRLLHLAGVDDLPWEDPSHLHNILRSLVFTADFDGRRTVQVPLGDLFGSAPGINPYRSYAADVQDDGTMILRFVMPYGRDARLAVENRGVGTAGLAFEVLAGPYRFGSDSYHFHAQWTAERGRTRPFRDMTFLEAEGEGQWVGSHLHVSNPTIQWWGEGDEKVYVDGETFPSTFGTGTEDYYGYAWCSPLLFQKPYHAQSRCDGPANLGHSSVNRWHVFDPIPYRRSLKFDMEMWHWSDVEATFAHTAFWYARPGGTGPVALNAPLLAPVFIERPKPVEGAIEGESLAIVRVTGGRTVNQAGFAQLSNGQQLWWIDQEVGDRLVLEVPVAKAGEYEVIACLGHARDYGIHRITLNGRPVAQPLDLYLDGLEWRQVSLGRFTLPAGKVLMEVECVGSNPGAIPTKRMFGLDYLLLK
jgi:hypothetical protein